MNESKLAILRKHLDELDEHLVELLAERFKITDQIGQYKSDHQLAPADPSREQAHLQRIRQLATKLGLNGEIAERVLRVIMQEVVKRHQAIQVENSQFL